MGNEFEVNSWEKQCEGKAKSMDDYKWIQYYAGEDKEEAFAVMEKLKESGAACVKLEWR